MASSLKRVLLSTTVVAFALALVSATTLLPLKSAEAQSEPQLDQNVLPLVYVNEVNVTVDAQHNLVGSFTARNSEKDAVGNLRYELQIISALPAYAPNELVQDSPLIYSRNLQENTFSLQGGEVRTIPLSQKLLGVPAGTYRARVQLLANDRKLGWNDQNVQLSGADGFIVVVEQSVTVTSTDPLTNETKNVWEPREGPNVDPNQQVILNAIIRNPGTKAISGTMTVQVKRQLSQNQTNALSQDDTVVTLQPSEAKNIAIPLTAQQKPGAYAILVSFHNGDTQVSGVGEYRYVVKGASASFASQTVQSLPMQGGLNAVVHFVVAGSADRVTPVKGVVRMTVSDDQGVIGTTETPLSILNFVPYAGTATLTLARSICGTPHVALSVVSTDGTVLEHNDVSMPAAKGVFCGAASFIGFTTSINLMLLLSVIAVLAITMIVRKMNVTQESIRSLSKYVGASLVTLIAVFALFFNMTMLVNANGIQQIIVRNMDPHNDPHPALFVNSPQHDSTLTSATVNYSARYSYIACGNEPSTGIIKLYEHISGGKVSDAGAISEWKLLGTKSLSQDKTCHNCDDRTPSNVSLVGTFTLASLSSNGSTTLWTVGDSRQAAMPALIYDFTWVNLNIAKPNLLISKTGPASGTVEAGTVGTFQITVTNNGTAPASNVQISDPIPMPAGTVFVPSQSDTRCAQVSGTTVVCSLGTMGIGAVQTVQISFQPPATTTCGPTIWFKNTASVSATGVTSVTSNMVTTTLVCPTPANLTITKTPSSQVVTRGDQLTYTIAVDNTTQGTANNVVVNDVLPSLNGGSLTVVSVQFSQGFCSQTSTSVTCNLGSMPGFSHATITLTVLVSSAITVCPNTSVIINTASVTATGIAAHSSAPVPVTVNCPVQGTLTIKKTATPSVVLRGDQMQYAIDVDAHTAAVDNVVVTDTLPTLANGGFTNVSVLTSQGTCSLSGMNITCSIGTITPGNLVRVTITATPAFVSGACQVATVFNTARVTGNNVAQLSSNSEPLTVNCPVQQGSLTLTKTSTPSTTVTRGQQLTYNIVAAAQTADVQNVTVTDQLPNLPNGTFSNVSVQTGHGTCSVNSGTVSCSLGTVQVGVPVRITISLIVGSTNDTYCQTSVLQNTASAYGTGIGTIYSNTLPVTVNCAAQPNLTITKTGPTSVQRGQTAQYTITVQNSGNGPATNVSVSDTIGTITNGFITIQSKSTTQGSCQIALPGGSTVTGIVSCDLGTVQANSTATITITLLMGGTNDQCNGTTAYFTNSATLSVNGQYTATSNVASTSVTCVGTPSLSIQKTANQSTLARGSVATYSITVTNNGTAPATNVVVTDPVPTIANGTVTFASNSSDTRCTLQGSNVVCALGTVNAGSTAQLTIGFLIGATTDVCNGTPANVANIAAVSGTNLPSVTSNTASITATCAGTPSLTLQKTASQSSITRGDSLTYTLTVTNNGSAAATNVSITDQLPTIANGTVVFNQGASSQNCSLQGSTVTCSVGTLSANGGTSSVQITVTVGALTNTCTGSFTMNNTASVTATGITSVSSNTSGVTVNCPQSQVGCIDITKYAYDYNGNVITSVPQFTFTLDGNQTTVNNSLGKAQFINVTPGTHTVTETIPATWTQQSVTPTGGTVQVVAGSSCVGVQFQNKQNQIISQGNPTISKTDNRTSAAPGEVLTYVLTVTNPNSTALTNVSVVDPLSSLLTYISASNGGVLNGSTVTWSNLTIPANNSITITVQAQIISSASNGAIITNVATVNNVNSSSDVTVVQTNNTGNLTISITDSPDPVRPCDNLNYVIQLQNPTSQTITTTVDQIFTSSDLSFVSASDTGFQNGNGVRWNSITINPNSSRSLSSIARVNCSAYNNESLYTTATANGATASTTTTVTSSNSNNNNFTVRITADKDPVRVGDTIEYTIRVTNNGNQTGNTDVILQLDSHTSFLDASANGRDSSSDEVIWSNVNFGRDESQTFRATVRVRSGVRDGQTLTADVRVTGDNDSVDVKVRDSNNTCTTDCNGNGSVVLTKQADRYEANPGDEITYSVMIRNTSGQDLSGIQVFDTFPSDMLQITDAGGGSISNGSISWTVDINNGLARTLVYRARISGAARAGNVIHNSVIAQGGDLSSPSNASADVRILGYLPQTGASDYTHDIEDTSRFLRPFSGTAGSSFGGLVALFSALGVSGLGFLAKRYFF